MNRMIKRIGRILGFVCAMGAIIGFFYYGVIHNGLKVQWDEMTDNAKGWAFLAIAMTCAVLPLFLDDMKDDDEST